jgi:hypothetical protein
MMTDHENSGEQAPEVTEAETSGGTSEPGNSETQADENTAKLNLTWKKNLEVERQRADALEARLARIEQERIAQTPAARGDADPRAKREQRVRQFAEQDDPVAQEILDLRDELRNTINGIGVMSQINSISDSETRDEVRRQYLDSLKNGNATDVRTVRAEVELQRKEAELERLKKELAKSAAKAPDKDVVRTHTREVPASNTKAIVMTKAEWDAKVADLRATQGDNAVRAFKRDTVNDKIVVRG